MIKRLLALMLIATNCNAAILWKCIDEDGLCSEAIAKTPNGWVLKVKGFHEVALVYIDDEKHEWKV